MSPMPQQTQNTFPLSLWHSSPLSIPLVSTVTRLQILKGIYSFNSFVLFFCYFLLLFLPFFLSLFFWGGDGGANMFSSESMPHFQFHCCVLHSSPATKVSSADLVLYCAECTPHTTGLLLAKPALHHRNLSLLHGSESTGNVHSIIPPPHKHNNKTGCWSAGETAVASIAMF